MEPGDRPGLGDCVHDQREFVSISAGPPFSSSLQGFCQPTANVIPPRGTGRIQFNIVSKRLGVERMSFYLNEAAMEIAELLRPGLEVVKAKL